MDLPTANVPSTDLLGWFGRFRYIQNQICFCAHFGAQSVRVGRPRAPYHGTGAKDFSAWILAQPDTNLGRSGLSAKKMAQTPAKRQPVFTTIAQLRPDTSGHNLTVKVRATERCSRRITQILGPT